MPILFPNALSDPQEYLEAQATWRRLFDRIKCEEYQGPMWTQWSGGTYANGTPCYDGSMPIFSQHCEARRKGINIWQVDAKEIRATVSAPETFFEAFVQLFDPDVAKINALDVTCVLSDENLKTAESLIRLHMVDDVTPEVLATIIEKHGLGGYQPQRSGCRFSRNISARSELRRRGVRVPPSRNRSLSGLYAAPAAGYKTA